MYYPWLHLPYRSLSRLKKWMTQNKKTKIQKQYVKLREKVCKDVNKCYTNSEAAIDELALALIPNDVPFPVKPIRTTGNGNCMFNAVSLALIGE